LPEPCASVKVGQLASGLAVALPAAVRHAVLPLAAGAVGSASDPAGPSRVLSWNGWLNSTVPAADAFGADTVIPTAPTLITSVTAIARATVRWASRRKSLHTLCPGRRTETRHRGQPSASR
jgi:hypothetical protein